MSATGLSRFGEVLGAPGARPMVAASLVGRLPMGMAPLAVVLLLRAEGRSYAEAGVVVAAYSLTLAAVAPTAGRLIDRFGQARVLVPMACGFATGLVVLAVLARAGAPLAVLVALALIAGASHPPLSASVRALWPQVLPAQHLREAAYAVEATLQEVFFVAGPLLVAVIATFSPPAALLTTAAFGLVGTLAFAATHPSRAARGRHRDAPHPGRAMASGGLRTIVLVCVGMGIAFGAVEVGMPAFAEHEATREAGGIALACFSAGSLLGGAVFAALPGARSLRARYLAALALFALALAPLVVAPSLWVLAVLALLAGMPIAPTFACAYTLVDGLVPSGAVTEAFAWISTSVSAGIALGQGLGGAAATGVGARAAFAVAVAAAVLALLAALARRRGLRLARA